MAVPRNVMGRETDVCVYCHQPRGLHGESAAGPEWLSCPPPHDRAVTEVHFRRAGPTVTCERCGCVQPIPHAIARHLGPTG
jgi:hypothetical protein